MGSQGMKTNHVCVCACLTPTGALQIISPGFFPQPYQWETSLSPWNTSFAWSSSWVGKYSVISEQVILPGTSNWSSSWCKQGEIKPFVFCPLLLTLRHPLWATTFIPDTPKSIYQFFSPCLPVWFDLLSLYFYLLLSFSPYLLLFPIVQTPNQCRAQVLGVCCARLL